MINSAAKIINIFQTAKLLGHKRAWPYCAPVGFLYLIIAAIYIYPLMKGFQFANATKAACLSNDEQQLARGIAGLNDLLKFLGILTIIILILYAIAIVFGLGLAAIGLAAMN